MFDTIRYFYRLRTRTSCLLFISVYVSRSSNLECDCARYDYISIYLISEARVHLSGAFIVFYLEICCFRSLLHRVARLAWGTTGSACFLRTVPIHLLDLLFRVRWALCWHSSHFLSLCTKMFHFVYQGFGRFTFG